MSHEVLRTKKFWGIKNYPRQMGQCLLWGAFLALTACNGGDSNESQAPSAQDETVVSTATSDKAVEAPEPTPAGAMNVVDKDRAQDASLWTLTTSMPEAQYTNVDWKKTLATGGYVQFPVLDPKQGDTLTFEKVEKVQPNQPIQVSMEIFDGYDNANFKDLFVDHISANGQQVWTHDISGDTALGWLPASFKITPTSDTLRLQVQLAAVGQPEKGWDWGKAARVGVSKLKIKPVQQ